VENNQKRLKKIDRICIIESDRLLADFMVMILEEFGFKIDVLSEKNEIQAYISEKRPRLYLIDIFLPQWNGLELIQYMKENNLLSGTRVIVLSAFGYQEVVQQAILFGASDFLLKPFEKQILLMKVKTQLMELYHGG
jgi:DNA-binding response OmpR family regulator